MKPKGYWIGFALFMAASALYAWLGSPEKPVARALGTESCLVTCGDTRSDLARLQAIATDKKMDLTLITRLELFSAMTRCTVWAESYSGQQDSRKVRRESSSCDTAVAELLKALEESK